MITDSVWCEPTPDPSKEGSQRSVGSSNPILLPSLEGPGVGFSLLRRLVLAIVLILQFISIPVILAATPTLSVKANRDRVYLGESFLLEVKVDGADNPGAPDLSAIRNGTTELLGSQSSSQYTVVIVNGQMRREGFSGRIFTYKVTPVAEGAITTGPITAMVNGAPITATGPVVSVTGVTQQDFVKAFVTASRATVLVDEPFDIQVTLRIKALPRPYQDSEPLFPADPPHLEAAFLNGQEIDGLKGPDFQRLLNEHLLRANQQGFTLNEYITQGDPFDFSQMLNMQGRPARFRLDSKKVVQDGQGYWEYTLTVPYSPLTEGSYTFGPLLFKGSVPFEVKADGTANGRPIFAVGPAATVRVIPPPEENRPDSYIGAIGSNLVVEAALDAQTCNVGDPLKLTLTLSGAIQMRNITPPRLTLQPALLERFEIYDDSVQTVKQNEQRQYVYTIRPRQAGSFEMPPVEVSYYDVTLRRYRTVRSSSIPLKVRQATEITASQIIGVSTNAGSRMQRKMELAMRPAGIRMGMAGAESASLMGNPRRVALYAGFGPAVFAMCLLGVWLRRQGPAFRRAQRQGQAFARARQALVDTHPPLRGPLRGGELKREIPSLEGCPKGGVGSAGDDEHRVICSVLRQYLADRFDVQADALTPDEAESLLTVRGIPYDLAKRFSGLMQRHFDASFGSSSAGADTKEILAMLAAVEGYRQERPRARLARTALLVALAGACVSEVTASSPAERSFIWTESLTGLSSAENPKDFLTVAGTCQKLVDLGVRNADLFFNQGTALLLAGKPADAVAVLLRAERYGGSAQDVARNLSIAEGRRQGLKTPVTSWMRGVLFWHYGLACSDRAAIAAMAFNFLWLAGALGLLGLKRTGRVVMVVAAVLFILFGSSVLATLQQESQATRPVAVSMP